MANTNSIDPHKVADHEHQAWQGAAPLYEEYISFMTACSGQLELVHEVSGISDDSVILDVGCGPGLLAAQLAPMVKSVVGIDFASNMIAEARSRFPDIEFHHADAENTPFDDHTFDCVILNYCAHHLARPERAFQELRRIIKPAGRIVILHPIQSRQACWGSFLKALLEELPPETNPSGPLLNIEEPEDYVSLLKSCGFVAAKCEVRVKPVEAESVNLLLTAAWAVTGLYEQPKEVQERIRAGTIMNTSQYARPDGGYHFPDEVLLAWAEVR